MTDTPAFELPMFPLGSVLFPHGILPLHIFEDRYQQMLNHVLEGDRRFGVVLIARGSEVGGGDHREQVGTIAHLDDHRRYDDGRAAVVATGQQRVAVTEWLPDAPYPRALVRLLDDGPTGPLDEPFLQARAAFDELIDVGTSLGRIEQAPQLSWDEDLDRACWQLAERSPIAALDRHAILEMPSHPQRLNRLTELLSDIVQDLQLMGRLGADDDLG